jgi:hypothetical protein
MAPSDTALDSEEGSEIQGRERIAALFAVFVVVSIAVERSLFYLHRYANPIRRHAQTASRRYPDIVSQPTVTL